MKLKRLIAMLETHDPEIEVDMAILDTNWCLNPTPQNRTVTLSEVSLVGRHPGVGAPSEHIYLMPSPEFPVRRCTYPNFE